jgi:murein L,D-transpeptidase YafK
MLKAHPIFVALALGWLACGPTGCNPPPTPIYRIEVFKARRELRLYQAYRIIKTCHIGLGHTPKPAKEREGDGATPEGAYVICCKNPRSQFHLSLGISYPGPHDAERGFKAGLISDSQRQAILDAHRHGTTPPWNTKLGGEIYIHGDGSNSDWTLGCIALNDKDMDELYPLVTVGTPIVIHP